MAYKARKNDSRSGNESVLSNNKATNNNQAAKGNHTTPKSGKSNRGSNLRDKVNSLRNGYNSLKNGINRLSNPLNRNIPGGIGSNNSKYNNSGGERNSSLPSSDGNKNEDLKEKAANASEKNEKESNKDTNESGNSKSIRDRLKGSILNRFKSSQNKVNRSVIEETEAVIKKKIIVTVSIVVGCVLGIVFLFLLFISIFNSILGNFGDLLGFNHSFGGDTGVVSEEYIDLSNQEFFNLVNEVKLEYLSDGIDLDATLVISVFHVINENKMFFDYDSIDKEDVKFVFDAMLVDGVFNEEAFKDNLVTRVFPRFGNFNESRRRIMVDEVYDYISDYMDFISDTSAPIMCGEGGNCVYDIKGFYVTGKGNVSERLRVEDLYVRLMQCGNASNHDYGGTFGLPLEGEELVPFEKYLLGVAYQEITPSAPKEAIKAQLVAARSYILARHVDMGDWRTLKKENGKWILQAASCTQDQVYCDPDKGCSGTNSQWGQVYSGMNHNNGFVKEPLGSSSQLRSIAKEMEGEVLVNDQGYIIYTDYDDTVQNNFVQLANNGLDYKQILLQVYNQGRRNYQASTLKKYGCGNSSECGSVSTGEYINWKQFEGPWANEIIAGGLTIKDIGCFATSISILIAKSGVETIDGANFNPGTFVRHMRELGGFSSGGFLQYAPIPQIAHGFKAEGAIALYGSREDKLNTIKRYLNEGYYLSAEVMGTTGMHFVAIDTVNGNNVVMMDPGSYATDMWSQYPWQNTSKIELFSVTR